MRSLWDKDSIGGEDGDLFVRIRECLFGITVAARNKFSGHLVCARLIHWKYLEDLLWSDRRAIMSSLFKRPAGTGGPGKAVGKPVDERFEKKYPTVFDFLTQDAWPDGEARERATIIVFAEGGTYKACLSDKTTMSCLWGTSDTFAGLLDALEGRLTEDKPDWRPSKPKKK